MNTIPHFVYELVDPRDHSIFYVGITINLYERYRQHMHCDGINPQKDACIQEIITSGHLPIMRTIEQGKSYERALERELYWIHYYLREGVKLTNIAGVPAKQQKTFKAAGKLQRFRIDDLDIVTFWFEGVEYNAATADADIFCKKAKLHADFGSIGWDALRQRSYFLSQLWDYCKQNGFTFPYDVHEASR